MYKEIYKSIQNPLDKEDFLDKILEAYTNTGDMYFNLTSINTKDKRIGKYLPKARDILEVETFNIWKNSLLNISSTSDNQELKEFAKYVNMFEPKTKKEVNHIRIDIMDKYPTQMFTYDYQKCDYSSPWIHKKSELIKLDEKYGQKTTHRLYINSDPVLTDIIAIEFIKKCMNKSIGYNFKYDEYGDRSDTMVIYCDTKHLPIYLDILKQIKQELLEKGYDNTNDYLHEPPILTGTIDGWIGYGSEPSYEDELPIELRSYNIKRTRHIENTLTSEMINWFMDNKKRIISYSGKKITYEKYFAIKIAEYLEKQEKEKLNNLGYTGKDIELIEYKKTIIKVILEYYNQIINNFKTKDINYIINFNHSTIKLPANEIYEIAKQLFKEAIDNIPSVKKDIITSLEITSIDWNITFNYAFDKYALKELVLADENLQTINKHTK